MWTGTPVTSYLLGCLGGLCCLHRRSTRMHCEWDSSRGQRWPQLSRWVARKGELPERNQKRSKKMSQIPAMFLLGLLRERNVVLPISRGSPAPSPALARSTRCSSQRRCWLPGIWRQTSESLPFNKRDLIKSSAPFGMLITKQPGEKCLGIKGLATLVLSFPGEGNQQWHLPELACFSHSPRAATGQLLAPATETWATFTHQGACENPHYQSPESPSNPLLILLTNAAFILEPSGGLLEPNSLMRGKLI